MPDEAVHISDADAATAMARETAAGMVALEIPPLVAAAALLRVADEMIGRAQTEDHQTGRGR